MMNMVVIDENTLMTKDKLVHEETHGRHDTRQRHWGPSMTWLEDMTSMDMHHKAQALMTCGYTLMSFEE